MTSRRTVLVTGCSDNGMGSALAIALHDKGWRVIASARNLSKMKTLEAAGIERVQLDVVSEESIATCVQEIKRLTGGSLDAIVNNAGAGYHKPLIHIDIAESHDLFDLNVFSIIRITRAFLPLLVRSERKPLIANNTSAAALLGMGVPFQGAYNASKAAAASITESLRFELQPFGVRVVNIFTGVVKTEFFANAPVGTVPPGSIYELAKDNIEAAMAAPPPDFKPMDAAVWAKQVAGDLSQSKPPYAIYRGTGAGTGRIATHLPIGTIDGMLKKSTGVDVLEKEIEAKGGIAHIRELLRE